LSLPCTLLVISLVTGAQLIGSFYRRLGASFFAKMRIATASEWTPVLCHAHRNNRLRAACLMDLDDGQNTCYTFAGAPGKDYRRSKLCSVATTHNPAAGGRPVAVRPLLLPCRNEKVYSDLSFWDELRGRPAAACLTLPRLMVVARASVIMCRYSRNRTEVRHLSGQDPSQKNPPRRISTAGGLPGRRMGARHRAASRSCTTRKFAGRPSGMSAAVGDDHLQRMERGTVSPESFTHGFLCAARAGSNKPAAGNYCGVQHLQPAAQFPLPPRLNQQ